MDARNLPIESLSYSYYGSPSYKNDYGNGNISPYFD